MKYRYLVATIGRKKLLSHSRRISHHILNTGEWFLAKKFCTSSTSYDTSYSIRSIFLFVPYFSDKAIIRSALSDCYTRQFYFILYGPDKPVNFLRHETISFPRYPRSRWKIRLRLRFDPSFRGNSIFWSDCSNFDLNYQDISPRQLGHGR